MNMNEQVVNREKHRDPKTKRPQRGGTVTSGGVVLEDEAGLAGFVRNDGGTRPEGGSEFKIYSC